MGSRTNSWNNTSFLAYPATEQEAWKKEDEIALQKTILNKKGQVRLIIKEGWVKIFLLKKAADTAFIRSLKAFRWAKKSDVGSFPSTQPIKKRGKPIFCNRKQSIEQWAKQTAKASGAVFPKDTKIWNSSEKTNEHVEIHAAYDKIRIAFLKEPVFPLTKMLKKPDK